MLFVPLRPDRPPPQGLLFIGLHKRLTAQFRSPLNLFSIAFSPFLHAPPPLCLTVGATFPLQLQLDLLSIFCFEVKNRAPKKLCVKTPPPLQKPNPKGVLQSFHFVPKIHGASFGY